MAGSTTPCGWLGTAAAFLCVLCAQGCRSSEEERLAGSDDAAKHGVYGEELRLAMRDLKALEQDLPPSIDPAAVERQRLEKLVELTRAMAASADGIPTALTDVELSDDRRAEFESLAIELRDRSQALADSASRLSMPQIEDRIEGIRATCLACHSRFRVLPVIRRP